MKNIFSGIQPSGNLHIGNYFGSILLWKNLNQSNKCFFGIMDLHSITVKQDFLNKKIIECATVYLASDIINDSSVIFSQSDVSEHAELAWILSCVTQLGWLNRMVQFKEKASKLSDKNINLGLYSYPVLMASDILLYNTDLVPVGEDQMQHIELTRDIAASFNKAFGTNFFKLPKGYILQNNKRIMSLRDGNVKMSKSDVSDYSRINLTDSAELIVKKIKKSKTDSIEEIFYDPNRKEMHNLINIFAICLNKNPLKIADDYKNSSFKNFKEDLSEAIIFKLKPLQEKIKLLKSDPHYVISFLKEGKELAKEVANRNLLKIKEIIGLYN